MREGKMIWGKEIARVSPFNLEALKLFWCLKDLKTVEGRVLEVGCGGGGMSKVIKFYRPDLKITSCDIDQKAINWAKKNPRGVKFKVADAYSLPFDDQYFSAVLTFDFLEHLRRRLPKSTGCLSKEAYSIILFPWRNSPAPSIGF